MLVRAYGALCSFASAGFGLKSWHRFAFAVLIAATVVWATVFVYTLQAYQRYLDGLSEIVRRYGYILPYWIWDGTRYLLIAGGFLLLAWMMFVSSYLASSRKP